MLRVRAVAGGMQKRLVLWVGDESAGSRVVRLLGAECPYRFMTSASSRPESAARNPPDLVVVDPASGKADAFLRARREASAAGRAVPPFLLVGAPGAVQRGFESGAVSLVFPDILSSRPLHVLDSAFERLDLESDSFD
ncbi:MAG: hypothetical protein HY814_12145 [Candidatus Riflebacteria bacterium]|nr:hypothetical protein [Candidatus Riflebacteria bacterium]